MTILKEGLITRRGLIKAGASTAAVIALEGVLSKDAKAADVANDFKNLTFLVHPEAWEVKVPSATIWDFGKENANAGIRQLQVQMEIDMANRGILSDLHSEIPVIIPTSPEGPFVDLQGRISTKQDAANLYGISGKRSSLPEAWDINQWGQAVLNPSSDGTLTPINPNGAVVDTWYNSKNGVQGAIVHPEITEFKIPSGTFWRFGTNTDSGVKQIVRGQMDRDFSPYVFYAIRGRFAQVGLARMFERKQELVDRFGVAGTWSSRFEAWDINGYGGATLWPNPDGSLTRVRPNGAVMEVKGGER